MRRKKQWYTVCESYIYYQPHEVFAESYFAAIDIVARGREKQHGRATPGKAQWKKEMEQGLVYGRFEWFVNKGKKRWIKDPIAPGQVYLNYKKPDDRL